MLYGYSHDQNGPWSGRKLGGDEYFSTPGEALEAGRNSFYHAGQDNNDKPAVWVAKLESVPAADFLIEGLQMWLSEMAEKAVIEFESGGQELADWLEMYSPGDAYIEGADPETDVVVAFTRTLDQSFFNIIEWQRNKAKKHWPIGDLTRVMKGDHGGYLKLEVEYNVNPKWNW